jgi:type I restriction enzyme R subunit
VSNFAFLKDEWPDLYAEARRAEAYAAGDPRGSCIYARSTVELAIRWLYDVDDTLRLPYERKLAAMLHEPTFRNLIGVDRQNKIDLIRRHGNTAVHEPTRPMASKTSYAVLRNLFHVLYWVARTYTRTPGSVADLQFDPQIVPRPDKVRAKTQAELKALADAIDARDAALAARDAEIAATRQDNERLEAELERTRAEIAQVKAANAAVPDLHDYDEATTRDEYIDALLLESGWPLADRRDTEYPVTGMPAPDGNLTAGGRVDYVLWGADGRPLALVEAKRTRRDAQAGQQQAKLYADALEKQFGRRPVIYYTNGYDHWVWDDGGYANGRGYPPRRVQGFATHDELLRWHTRRAERASLVGAPLPVHIAGRPYQQEAMRAVGQAFDHDHDRAALLVMATGTGKTRTAVGIVDLLMKAGWVKNVLFLADRAALVRQTARAFTETLPDVPLVNLLQDKSTSGRVVVSTYPTILNLLNQTEGAAQRRFGPGHFDLVIIDEAHRSVYQKYRQIFAYFDALLLGLTATPKE